MKDARECSLISLVLLSLGLGLFVWIGFFVPGQISIVAAKLGELAPLLEGDNASAVTIAAVHQEFLGGYAPALTLYVRLAALVGSLALGFLLWRQVRPLIHEPPAPRTDLTVRFSSGLRVTFPASALRTLGDDEPEKQ